jgi:glycosyltransferase involved in cell wall biosynthesis
MLPSVFAALVGLRREYDVIYCPDPRGVGLPAIAVGKALGRPVVFEAATPGSVSCDNWNPTLEAWGVRGDGRLASLIKALPRRMYASADGLACLSEEIEAEARAAGVPDERLCRVPHGVDLERFRPARNGERHAERARLGVPQDAHLFLFVGRLSLEKGLMDMLEAWRTARPEGARLVLVGPDSPGHPLDAGPPARAFVATHGMQDSVTFAGPVEDPSKTLRAADVFIHPSHYEAFGISVAEALASGLPVVATEIPGFAGYLTDGVNALLCPPGDPSALSAVIGRIALDADLRRMLGERARATAEERFDLDRSLGALLDLVRRAVSGPERRRA